MRNNNHKNSKQHQNYRLKDSSTKRSGSPLGQVYQPHQKYGPMHNNKSGSIKKISNSPYQKVIKEFESYGKSAKKKNQEQKERGINNKFRIVTEPVDDRIMHLAQSNIFNSSLANRDPSTYLHSKKKLQTEVRQSSQGIRLNLRQNSSHSKSRQKGYSNKGINMYPHSKSQYRKKQSQEQPEKDPQCPNCSRYAEEIQYLYSQIKRIMKGKNLWKNGNSTYQEISQIFQIQNDSKSTKTLSYNSSIQGKNKINREFLFADSIIKQIKVNMADLIKDIEILSSIDYPKMLAMDIFKYQPLYNDDIGGDHQQNQIKDLLGQLRLSVEGKFNNYDTYDTQSENSYTKMIMRNLKARLNCALRENLELKIKKSILQKSQAISEQSEQYLRMVIEEVLMGYCKK